MKGILSIFLVVLLVAVAGCTSPSDIPEKPIGKDSLNLCIADPVRAGYWQKTDEALWNTPEDRGKADNRAIVAGFPACDNASVTIWEYRRAGGGWYRVTLQTKDGRSGNGWLPADHLMQVSNESGTEWSNNYSSITGLWDRTRRGNGAKIWYDFRKDGTFTFNYDMMGNRDNMQDTGSWRYIGNNTYDLISNVSGDHGRTTIILSPDVKSFHSGIEYSSDSAVGRDIIYAKE